MMQKQNKNSLTLILKLHKSDRTDKSFAVGPLYLFTVCQCWIYRHSIQYSVQY